MKVEIPEFTLTAAQYRGGEYYHHDSLLAALYKCAAENRKNGNSPNAALAFELFARALAGETSK